MEEESRVRELREERGFSIDYVVRQFHSDGLKIGKNTLSGIERGLFEPTLTVWEYLARLYGVRVRYLLGIDDVRC